MFFNLFNREADKCRFRQLREVYTTIFSFVSHAQDSFFRPVKKNGPQAASGRRGVKVTIVLQHSIITSVTTSTKVEPVKTE